MRRRTCWTTQEIKDRAKLKLGTTLQILKKLERHGIVKSNRPTEASAVIWELNDEHKKSRRT
jgi:DNA-binding PadR family transcriptional regulator